MTRYPVAVLTCMLALALTASGAYAASPELTVKIGTNRVYTRSQLRPGGTVVCHYQGHTLSVAAPAGKATGSGALWPLPGETHKGLFVLSTGVMSKGGYNVVCLRGGFHW